MNEGWFGETRKKLENPYSFCGNGFYANDMPIYPSTLAEIKNFDSNKLDSKYKFDLGKLSK
jgi:hypothetical protein